MAKLDTIQKRTNLVGGYAGCGGYTIEVYEYVSGIDTVGNYEYLQDTVYIEPQYWGDDDWGCSWHCEHKYIGEDGQEHYVSGSTMIYNG